MKTKIIKNKNLNGGKKTEIKYVITDSEIENQINEIFKEEEYGFYKKPGGVYIDVGANSGMATLYFSQFAKKIYSIEPNPQIYETLVLNTKHLGDQVETFNCALSPVDMDAMIYSDNDEHLAQTFFPRSNHATGIRVDSITPTQLFKRNNIKHVDVMKVDIEEAEYVLFADDDFGAITPMVDVIIGESHYQKDGGFPESIPLLLERWGYETEYIKLKHPNYFQRFTYTNYQTGQKLTLDYPRETIFVAKKTKKK